MIPSSLTTRLALILALVALAPFMTLRACVAEPEKDVRYDPSPPAVTQAMLRIADVAPGDTLYDLGSGDGRIVIAAARDFDVERAIGVEIDPELVARARANAREAGVAERVRFVRSDLFEYDFSDASVVTLFLLPRLNIRLRPRLLSELTPGTRIVSHEHDMDAWQPDDQNRVDGHMVYLWDIPARVEGRWESRVDGVAHRLALKQRFQTVSGTLVIDGQELVLADAGIDGKTLRFSARPVGQPEARSVQFEGRVEADRIEGELRTGEGAQRVTARRAE